MAKLQRKNLKIFGENAPLTEMGQFGSALATTKKNTKDIEEIQGLEAWQNGWGDAVISNKNYPPMEEMNGVLNVLSYQQAYTLQEGIPEWNADTVYYKGSIVKTFQNSIAVIYISMADDNVGNALSNSNYWMVWIPPNLANTDLSNLSDVGKKFIDGQWVSKTETLSTATAVGTYEIDLSTYLPDDNYNYEVLVSYTIALSSNTTGTRGYITSDVLGEDNYLDIASISPMPTSGYYNRAAGGVIIPAKNSLTFKIGTGKANGVTLSVNAYRRIGTNQ